MIELLAASKYFDGSAYWQILALGLGFGAGGTAVFALGLVALQRAQAGASEGPASATAASGRALAWIAAVLCFLVVLGAVAYGIDVMLEKK